ncbi:hypothetical protein Zmor_007440 [Zophobas morio]|uniref:Uncharacterized protein n=1 Tax=Zophobas morio TaxID=2755281 RepID=A0AA38IZA3_9CUCU|nr:hypothetical protein Zmor_007440 [Zophobas morio]
MFSGCEDDRKVAPSQYIGLHGRYTLVCDPKASVFKGILFSSRLISLAVLIPLPVVPPDQRYVVAFFLSPALYLQRHPEPERTTVPGRIPYS